MSQKQFEDRIKNKLFSSEAEVGDGLFDSIMEKRAARPRIAAAVFKKWMLAAVVAGAIAGTWYFNSGDSDLQSPTLVQEQTNKQLPITEPVIEKSSDNQKDKLADNPATPPQEAETSVTSISKGKSKSVKSNKNKVSDKSLRHKNVNQNRQKPESTQNSESQPESFSDIASAYFNVDAPNRPEILNEYHSGNSHLFIYNTVKGNALENADVQRTKVHLFSGFASKFVGEEAETAQKVNFPPKPEFSGLYLEPFMGYSVNSVNSSDSRLDKISGMGNANTAGLNVGYMLSDRFDVFSGVSYSRMNAQYKGRMEYNEDFTEINTHTSYINDPVLGTIQVITHDTVSGQRLASRDLNFRNSFNVVSIPLGFNYHFRVRKMDLFLNASMNFNHFSPRAVYAWNQEIKALEAVQSTNSFYSMGAGFGLMGQFPLRNNMSLIVGPNFNCNRLGGSQSKSGYNERIFNTGLKIGLRYQVL